jgi:hypothetical protein
VSVHTDVRFRNVGTVRTSVRTLTFPEPCTFTEAAPYRTAEDLVVSLCPGVLPSGALGVQALTVLRQQPGPHTGSQLYDNRDEFVIVPSGAALFWGEVLQEGTGYLLRPGIVGIPHPAGGYLMVSVRLLDFRWTCSIPWARRIMQPLEPYVVLGAEYGSWNDQLRITRCLITSLP